eukprot:1997707-Pyramimonas_sp.AAC.1
MSVVYISNTPSFLKSPFEALMATMRALWRETSTVEGGRNVSITARRCEVASSGAMPYLSTNVLEMISLRIRLKSLLAPGVSNTFAAWH